LGLSVYLAVHVFDIFMVASILNFGLGDIASDLNFG